MRTRLLIVVALGVGQGAVWACGSNSTARGGSGTTLPPALGDSVLMHHKNPSRDGVYVQPSLTKAAAATLTKDASFTATFQGHVYAQPLFVDGMGSSRDLVIVATEANNVHAFDAATGAEVWKTNLGTPVPLAQMPCGNIDPFGVTGTPVIDPTSRTLYLDSLSSPDGASKQHRVFALSIDDGSVRSGWPVDVAAKASSSGTTFKPEFHGERGALAFVGGTVYVPFGGHFGDCGEYHGWLVAISAADPNSVKAWATSSLAGGAWSVGGVASDGANVFIATGNTEGATAWSGGEAILSFPIGASLASPSYWSPTNWKDLDNSDTDIGGSGPITFDLAGSSPSQLVLSLGKDGNAYLLDRTNLGGVGAPVAQAHVATGAISNAAAVYTTTTATRVAFKAGGAMCTSGSGALTTLEIKPGSPPTIAHAWCASQGGQGSPMVTTTDGHAEAIVWAVGAEGDKRLYGFDGDTGATIFTSPAGAITGNVRHFTTPIAAKGRIFVASDDGVVAFKL
jgi:outer membrane protein assembly factor BamB